MSRSTWRPTSVLLSALGLPLRVQEPDCSYQLDQLLEQWREAGKWWEGEHQKSFFRFVADEGILLELCNNSCDDSWTMRRR